MRVAFVLSSLALVGFVSAAAPARAEEEKPCRQQIEELCPDSSPNTPERRACVQEKGDKLTESCQKMIGHVKGGAKPAAATPPAPAGGGLQGLVQACGKDHPRMVELCQTGKAQNENPMPCLIEHSDQFSEPCRNWLKEAEKAQAEKAQAKKSQPQAATKAPAAD